MKKLLLASVAALLMATSAAHAQSFPTYVRGKWCYAGSVENGDSKVMRFKRGACTDNMLIFTSYSRFSKWGKTSNQCRINKVEDTGNGSLIDMICEGLQIKWFFYPTVKNGLNILNIMDLEDVNIPACVDLDPEYVEWLNKNDIMMPKCLKEGN
jgi:hypothetical protein